MPMTRRSSTGSKKDEDDSKSEKTENPKLLLKNFIQLNETVPPSQPDESPTVTNIKRKASRRSSRRSSGMRALAETPHVLLKNFIENAPEETPVQINSSDDASIQSDIYLAPIPRKISKMVDDQNLSSEVETDDVVRKMPRIRHKAVLQKLEGLKQQSESPGEDSSSEIMQLPSRAKKIRNKITAEDIASGIKLSQEKAAETERYHNLAETTKTETSLGYLSVNTLNAENLGESITAVPETQGKSDSLAEREDSASSKSETSSKRKRSKGSSEVEMLFDLSEETMQKAKMLRLEADTAESVSPEGDEPAEVRKTDVSHFVSEAELPEVAHNVEVAESVEVVGHKRTDSSTIASDVSNEQADLNSSRTVSKISKEILSTSGFDTEAVDDRTEAHSKKEKINLDEFEAVSVSSRGDVSKGSGSKEKSYLDDVEAVSVSPGGDDSDVSKGSGSKGKSYSDDVEAASVSSRGDVSKGSGSKEKSYSDDIEAVRVSPRGDDSDVSKRSGSKRKSYLDDVEAASVSPRGDDSDVSKGSVSKKYLAESIGSSYVEATSKTTEIQKFTAKEYEKPLLSSKVEESLASGHHLTSDIDTAFSGVFESNLGSVSARDAHSSRVSHASSPIVSDISESPAQSDETEAKEQESIEASMPTDEKDEEQKSKELGSLAGERVSTDEHDEFPKETTSSEHSRSSSPPSSEADKATQRLTLPSSKSAFVEMKSTRSASVLSHSTSGVSKKRLSSVKKSSKKEKSSSKQRESKSYRMVDSVVSPTESAPSMEVSHLTKDAQILPQSPFGSMRTLKQTTGTSIAPESQAGPSQNTQRVSKAPKKNKISAHLKKYIIPPKVTNLLINHYSGVIISKGCLPDLGKISDRFFDNLFETLSSYAKHASRKKN